MARGRRKLTAEEPGRTVRIFANVTPSEKAAIIAEAVKRGQTVSDFLRMLAMGGQ